MLRLVWEDVPADVDRVSAIATSVGVPPVIARLLCQRGLDTPDAAIRFLSPALSQLHDPYLLLDMRPAIERLRAAIARGEQIAIHGDYDVDGITATVILRRAIELLGGRVVHFVPDRMKDGYGLQAATIDRLQAAGAHVIVSVDCGIRATEAAVRARELGLDLIITDHHEPETALPPAFAVINPKRPGCTYPDKMLAGVGVALKVVQALFESTPHGPATLAHFIKIAAIGTLADVVPLVGENRVIASFGLSGLSRGPHGVGLEALLEEAQLSGRRLDSFHVSFMLAPRLNAAGRMSSPDLAADLLLLRGRDDEIRDRARQLAKRLSEENAKRREQEAEILAEARRSIERDPQVGAHNMLVVAGEGWHRGVIGIVASKLVEQYHKPTLVLSIEDGIARGSGRSIAAFDLLAALESCADVFLQFGGHRQAAGVTLDASRVGELRQRLGACANERLRPEDLVPRLRIDAPLGLREISGDIVAGHARLGPFGAANPKPVFRASPIDLIAPPRKIKDRHLSLLVKQESRSFKAIAWRAADREDYLSANRCGLELAYSLEESEYRGERTTELVVADIRVPAGASA
ncbi:MAG TPA: single-stranded-DNA-specific exonuclease RecJ [Vicinamibacterales bacterium]|jgi:single-stranded-DNA-specific exonuclease|nr:single-stranded-DNA-specific exonuclease RecJ [Vicinamibacterales bacterium]